jgi:hypothetical protein
VGQSDRPVQQDAPSFFDDAGGDGGGGGNDGGGNDGGGGSCYPEPDESVGGDTCAEALDRGSLSFSASNHVTVSGNLWPEGDVDWYKVAFVDAPTPANCGMFKAKISFSQNPNDHFRFDVMLDNCTSQATCLTVTMPDGGTAADGGVPTGGLTSYTLDGLPACPCVAPGGPPSPTADNVFLCNDYSVTLRIRVFRTTGAPAVCENYELSIDNG